MKSVLEQELLEETSIPKIPSWIAGSHAETNDNAAFLSGAALSHLHIAVHAPDIPQGLLRNRQALCAAERCLSHAGRTERLPELRDALAWLRPGDQPGPAGEIALLWCAAVEKPHSTRAFERQLRPDLIERLPDFFANLKAAPVSGAAQVIERVLETDRRAEAEALLLADVALSRALKWSHAFPLLGIGLRRADLRKTDVELQRACHRAVHSAAQAALQHARDLQRRAAHLRQVAPKLRAKGAVAAVALFLERDALSSAQMTVLRSDRAARRFCERLVTLGAVRELTGRDTFRLYGL